jgi:outer membrane protein assembly factor BamB
MIRSIKFLAVAAVTGMIVAPLHAQKILSNNRWPQFRGPNSLGVAREDMELPVQFGPASHVVWKTPLPPGHSSPCIWDERIFLTGFDSEAKTLVTLCLDRQSGQVLWRRTIPAQQTENVHQEFNSPAVATPATDGDRVYVYFASYGLLCYDFEGNEHWKKPLPLARTMFGTGSSPVVAGELVLLNRDFQPEPSLLAVRARTGETVWKQVRALASLGGPVDAYATPVVWHHDGVDEVMARCGSRPTTLRMAASVGRSAPPHRRAARRSSATGTYSSLPTGLAP